MNIVANILIVDDHPANLDALEAILAAPDYRLIRASSADECLLALLKDDFAVIILDIKMPDMSGLELAHLIKQRKRCEHVPILFLTAHVAIEEDILRGYGAGAVSYLTKPVNPTILRSKIAVFVDLYRQRQALAAAIATLEKEIAERHNAEEALRRANEELETRVQERTFDLSRANDALRESQERLQAILQHADAAMYLISPDGRFLQVNRKFEELFGTTNKAVHGRPITDYFSPQFSATFQSNNRQVMESGVPLEFEEEILLPSGEMRVHQSIKAPLFDETGNLKGIVGISTDISDRKRIEEERIQLLESERQARGDAEKANRLKDEFLAMVSHELRNPLNAMMGWCKVLQKMSGSHQELREGLQVIERNAKVQSQLISDLMDGSRISSGKMRLNLEPLELRLAIHDAIDTILPSAEAKNIRIEPTFSEHPIWVHGDPQRIRQITANILSNAVKFTEHAGRIHVGVTGENSIAVVTVSDNGRGIKPDLLPHIFERFRQCSPSPSRNFGGLGLGLAIVKSLVELHAGRVIAESPGEGLGATFRVELPLFSEMTQDGNGNPQATAIPSISGLQDIHSFQGIAILVIEDEIDSREFLKRLLEEHGARVTTASSAQEGYQMLVDEVPDVVLSDIGMPEEDGYSLMRRIRESGFNVPAIAVTAFARPDERARARVVGFDAHIAKPLDPVQLLGTIARLVSRSRSDGGSIDSIPMMD